MQSPFPNVRVLPSSSSLENADPIGEVEDPTPVLSNVSFVEPTGDETFEGWTVEQLKIFLRARAIPWFIKIHAGTL